MSAPNLISVTSIYGKTAVQNVNTVSANVIANAAASGKVQKINSITVTNTTGSVAADITVALNRSGVDYRLAYAISVPAKSALVLIGKDAPLYLEEGDYIKASASANASLEIVASYEELA